MGLKVAFLSTFMRQIVVMAVGLVTVSIISRLLGSEEFGKYSVAVAFVSLAQSVVVLSVPSIVIHFYSRSDDPSQLFSCGFFASFCLLVLLTAIYFLLFYFGFVSSFGLSLEALVLVASLLWFHVLNNLFESSFLATREYKYFNFLQAAVPVFFCALSFLFLKKGDGWIDVLKLANVSSVLATPIYFFLSSKKIKLAIPNFRKSSVGSYVGYGVNVWFANLFTMALYRAPIFIAERLCLPREVGIYALVNNFSEKIWVPGKAVATILFPERSSSSKQGGIKQKNIYRLIFGNMFLALLGMAALTVVLYFHGSVFFGRKEDSLFLISVALMPGIVAWSGVNILGAELAGLGLSKINFYVSLFALFGSLIGSSSLAALGAVGIAAGASIGYVIGFLLSLYFYKKSAVVMDKTAK